MNLIAGRVGTSYADIVHITGGIPSYRFRVTEGTLPPGLSLNSFNGEITGSPTLAGHYVFTITVNDHDVDHVLKHNGVSRSFTVEVTN